MKKILNTALLGQKGINLIEKIVLDMGFLWTPTGSLEAGIDGIIETRDPGTGQALNSIIQVQSKALTEFAAETDSTFDYSCKEKDLDYWIRGNAPVILIVSKPEKDEAYWVPIKKYFADAQARKGKKVRFNKKKNLFTSGSRADLLEQALPTDSGIYLSPIPKDEKLYSNILTVNHLGPVIFEAETEARFRWQVSDLFRKRKTFPGTEWELSDGRIYSFHDLSSQEWSEGCRNHVTKRTSATDWIQESAPSKRHILIRLANRSLKRMLSFRGVEYHDKGFYFFRASQDLKPIKRSYHGIQKKCSRFVFQGYPRVLEEGRNPSYYRHSAFEPKFHRFGDTFYLEINPTYFFTWDGVHRYHYHEERLKGIKRLEKNAAVLGQVIMWAEILIRSPGLFDFNDPFLRFGGLEKFHTANGINDVSWLPREEKSGVELVREQQEEQSTFLDEH